MLNLGTYRHMTRERYLRYLTLLQTIEEVDPSRELAIQELYLLLDPCDREDGPRQAMIGRLRRDGVITRVYSRLPIRYEIRPDRISRARESILLAIAWDRECSGHPALALASATP